MNITEFAEGHRLKTQRDECGDVIVPGKSGHIYGIPRVRHDVYAQLAGSVFVITVLGNVHASGYERRA